MKLLPIGSKYGTRTVIGYIKSTKLSLHFFNSTSEDYRVFIVLINSTSEDYRVFIVLSCKHGHKSYISTKTREKLYNKCPMCLYEKNCGSGMTNEKALEILRKMS